MYDLGNLNLKYVAINGKMPSFTGAELEILLKARGAGMVGGGPAKGKAVLLTPTAEGEKVEKARTLGMAVVTDAELRESLGAPLQGWKARFDLRGHRDNKILRKHVGAPVSPEDIARIEARIGFALPEAARNFFAEVNGVSLLWANVAGYQGPSGEPIPWNEAMHEGGPLWAGLERLKATSTYFWYGMVCIPPVETIFFETWKNRVFPEGRTGKISVGKRKMDASAFYDHLYLFDAFHPYYQAALWADQERKELSVVFGSDYGADWLWSAPISLELYLDYLCVASDTRVVEPVSRLGMPKTVFRLAGQSWTQLSPFNS